MPRISQKCVGTLLLSLKKLWPEVTENFGHLYHDGKITAVVRDLRLSWTAPQLRWLSFLSFPQQRHFCEHRNGVICYCFTPVYLLSVWNVIHSRYTCRFYQVRFVGVGGWFGMLLVSFVAPDSVFPQGSWIRQGSFCTATPAYFRYEI